MPERVVRDIASRAFEFAVRIVKLCRQLDAQGVPRRLTSQLLGAGTGIGSNVEEGQAAQSRADFINKYLIALKEARESKYWLRLLLASELLSPSEAEPLIREATEIALIIAKSVVTAKNNRLKQAAISP